MLARAPKSTRPFEVRSSPMQGQGVFATRAIPVGVRLVEYGGERLTPAQAEARYPDLDGERHHTFLFAIDDDLVIDAAVDDYVAKWINHSCDPNCDAVVDDRRIWIETIRPVRRGRSWPTITPTFSTNRTGQPPSGGSHAIAAQRVAGGRYSARNADQLRPAAAGPARSI